MNKSAKAPHARTIDFHQHHHGRTKCDEYAWLRDDNWQQVMKQPELLNADIRTHLEAENRYTDQVMASTQALQDALFGEMRGRICEDDASVPVNEGSLAWATRYRLGDEHPLICCGPRDGAIAAMRVVVDVNREAAGKDFFKLASYAVNRQASCLAGCIAWAFDDKGSEYFTICLRDMKTGKDGDVRLTDTAGAVAWSACGDYLFYVAVDKNHRPDRIMRHQPGTAQSDDICIYQEADAGFFIGLSTTRSGRFLVISAHDHETSEAWLIDAHDALAPLGCVASRRTGIEYVVDDDGVRDRLMIVTNWVDEGKSENKAEDFQIVTMPVSQLDKGRAAWQVLQVHKPGCLILNALAFKDFFAVLVRENALPRIHIINLKTHEHRQISFDEETCNEAYDVDFGAMAEYDTSVLRFTYASMTTPQQTFDYDMATGTRYLRKTQQIPSGHQPDDYVTRRITATGHDGAQIPMSLLYHKDTKLDATAPVLLYGYGAYGITIPAAFSTTRLSLVDRGFIYAIAHIRGGKACGHHWFEQGRGPHKPNSFEDFAAAARALIERGWTHAGQITMHGGSAGGLLVGATLNLAPELFCAGVAEVPFVDVLTTMLDDTLPLTPPEWPEWGNPITSRDAYDLIASYAPYENITPRPYPHVLATGGLTDPRVTYWEPAKWVARLRALRDDARLTLLRMEMSAGHGGKAGRFNQLHEIAFVYAFILMVHQRTDNDPAHSKARTLKP